MRQLAIRREGDEYLVGELGHGTFVELPPIAIEVIEALREGRTVAETARITLEKTGEEVDVADFAEALVGLGFVAEVDGVAVASSGDAELTLGGRTGAVVARLARPLFSGPAWVVYVAAFAGCVLALTTVPRLRPTYRQLFFLPNPVLSVALLTVISLVIAVGHESAHWLGARVAGVPARITVSRRYYLLALQTDLSALWALPPRRRLGPLLAGMAWNTVLTAALITARWAVLAGWWHPPVTLARLLAAIILSQVISVSMQFLVFLRTDIYAVLVTGLGCRNLTRVSRLQLTRRYRKLTPAEARELAAAGPRDLAAARWYGWLQLSGLVLMLFYFTFYFAPATGHVIRWTASGLRTPGGFWQALVSGCAALVPAAVPPATWLRDLYRRRPVAHPASGEAH